MPDSPSLSAPSNSSSARPVPWWEKLIALIAVANLILALFNLTYVPLRDFYFHYIPGVVSLYDPIKGIEPHPFTQDYLHTVDRLEATLSQTGEFTPQAEELLASLRNDSAEMIAENPFLVASKFGTFAQIKRQMREHLGTKAAQPAFKKFWSSDYLAKKNWREELSFFDERIYPLIHSNYYRYVDDYGRFIDEFWRLDIFFIGFFAVEFLTRTLVMSYRQAGKNWFDTMLRRWYDIFLLLPVWRWLRIIPVTVRLHTTKIVNLERILAQITHEPASYLADRVSQFLLVRLVNQARDSVKQGDAARAFLDPQPYLKVSEANKVEVITDRLLELTIYKILPRVQPDLESLLHYSLRGAFKDSDFYKNLQQVPGIQEWPEEFVETLANQLAQTSVEILASSYSDAEGRKLFGRLSQDFNRALRLELQDKETLAELESLLSELLDEVKINYITRSAQSDPTQTMEEVDQILEQQESSSAAKSEPES